MGVVDMSDLDKQIEELEVFRDRYYAAENLESLYKKICEQGAFLNSSEDMYQIIKQQQALLSEAHKSEVEYLETGLRQVKTIKKQQTRIEELVGALEKMKQAFDEEYFCPLDMLADDDKSLSEYVEQALSNKQQEKEG